jgi:hypothetical protein
MDKLRRLLVDRVQSAQALN